MISIGAIGIPGVVVPGVQIPGSGPIFGTGTLASLLTGLLIGAAAGGLIGALVAQRVPDEEAEQFAAYLPADRTVVTVHLRDDIKEDPIVTAFEEEGAYDIRVYEAPAEAAVQGVPRRPTHAEPVGPSAPAQAVAPEDGVLLDTPQPEATVGEASAHADALGSGAEGGLGTGEPMGDQPLPWEPAAPAEPEVPVRESSAPPETPGEPSTGEPMGDQPLPWQSAAPAEPDVHVHESSPALEAPAEPTAENESSKRDE